MIYNYDDIHPFVKMINNYEFVVVACLILLPIIALIIAIILDIESSTVKKEAYQWLL